ncbi:Mu transposase C-terminal domain-containing protein [soil metagenome]
MHPDDPAEASRAQRTGTERDEAMARWEVLRPHLNDGVSLSQTAREVGVPLRSAQRWLARYRADGWAGLTRVARSDRGRRKLPAEWVEVIEGLALCKPPPSVASIHRRITTLAVAQKSAPPSYSSVYAIVRSLNPALVVLAQEGEAAFRDRFELIHRHRAERPNALWQADHTELDLLILDANGATVRPWLTTVIDDHSRAVAGYTVFLGAPSALQTALALRQAIWRKADPEWPVCGIPDILYVDHGSDFTSHHLEQAAAALHFELVYSAVGRPQGRGKVERLFGTLGTELLPELPGHLVGGKPATPPRLSLSELDAAIGAFLIGTYHAREHREIGVPPRLAWLGEGWLPRMPESLEELDCLLVLAAKSRVVRRDGIHFQGLRYLDPTLAAYVGETVTLRYDPRDLAEIRVFHRDRFLCRAISPEHAGSTITLKDIQAARAAHRRALREEIRERIARVADFLPNPVPPAVPPPPRPPLPTRSAPRLWTYFEDSR